MSNINRILEEAIENKHPLSFSYDGLERVAEPHHYGLYGKENQLHLHAYQTEGKSKNDKVPEWKNFAVDKIMNLDIKKDETFEVRGTYDPTGAKYSEVYKRVNTGI